MLGRKDYTRQELDHAKVEIDRQLMAHKKLVATLGGSTTDKKAVSALQAFDALFFNNMALVLDRPFVHRLRSSTGKDGNALNELELLCESLINNNGVLRGNNVIKYIPEQSVTKLKVGEQIQLTADDFGRLSTAFFSEIEQKFL